MFRKKMRNTLTQRLILFICITVIPINILAVTVSGIVIKESRDKVILSYENDLKLFMEHKRELIRKMDDWYEAFIIGNMNTMYKRNSFSSVESIKIIQSMGTILNDGSKGFAFLYEKQADEKLYIKMTKDLYSYERSMELRNELNEYSSQWEGKGYWQLQELGTGFFYSKVYQYPNYSLGFMIDIKEELLEWIELAEPIARELLIIDGKVSIIIAADGAITRLGGDELEDYLKKNNLKVSYTDARYEMYIISEGIWGYIPAIYWGLLIIAFLSMVMLIILWRMIRQQVIYPLMVLWNGMQELDKNECHYRIVKTAETKEFSELFESFNRMADNIMKAHEKDIILYQVELENLRLQVNPHMLLNSFNMIYSMAQTEEYYCIQKYAMHLGEYFRYVLRENTPLVTVRSEMHFVENYIEIQKIRYPGEVTSVYTLDKAAERALIPPLLIENFVENAMKYARIPEQVTEVLINIRIEKERLLISICDTGKGILRELLDVLNRGDIYVDKNGQKHIGIWNCRRRMEALYAGLADLKISSIEGQGTQVWIELPYMLETDEGIAEGYGNRFTKDRQQEGVSG